MEQISRQTFNNDPRWRLVDSISDLLAILAGIETHRHFIATHASRADMHNVALNLKQIISEVAGMSQEIQKLKLKLAALQGDLIESIYETENSLLVRPKVYPGSADNNAGYVVSIGDKGQRFRRVWSDYRQ